MNLRNHLAIARSLFAFGLAIAPVAAPALASTTDFTVRGTGSSDVDLPHPLTTGNWIATLDYTTEDSLYYFWMESLVDGSSENLFRTGDSRTRFRVGPDYPDFPPGRAFINPIGADYSWSIRFVKEGTKPEPEPEPEPPPVDDAPCDAAGEGVNLLGHQVFMCIVASGEVHQLPAQKLSDKVAVFGRRSDPKAVVKLVGGCTWGAIAAVTTARRLQIRVYNTANGNEWEHNHNSGGLAPSGYAGNALCDEAGS